MNNGATAAAMWLGLSVGAAMAVPAVYPTPDAAVEAFVKALVAQYKDAMLVVFGPEAADLIGSGDATRDSKARDDFLAGYRQFHALNDVLEGKKVLEIGRTLWPFPVLLLKNDAGWSFDPAEARDEILSRRIGLDELDVIDIMHRAAAASTMMRTGLWNMRPRS